MKEWKKNVLMFGIFPLVGGIILLFFPLILFGRFPISFTWTFFIFIGVLFTWYFATHKDVVIFDKRSKEG